MKKFINYINESKQEEYEKTFLELAHIDELIIKFDFIEYNKSTFYFYKDLLFFEYINKIGFKKEEKLFYINNIIWIKLKKLLNISDSDTQKITQYFIKKLFNLIVITGYNTY